jgi:hypothetical protein
MDLMLPLMNGAGKNFVFQQKLNIKQKLPKKDVCHHQEQPEQLRRLLELHLLQEVMLVKE